MADISKIKVPINGTATTYNVKDATARTHISDTTVHVTAADKTNWNAKSELTLGETSTTAYRGDRGKTAYTHATDSSRLTTDTDAGLYKVGCTAEGHIKELTAIVKSDITGLGIPGSDTNTIPSAYCNTAAGTAAKTASCTDYTLTSKTYLHVLIKTANSSAGKITLNVNSKGAKDIWINGAVSSASNYTLPAGSYITYYDGSKYLFRTDGKLVTSDLIAGLGTAAVKDVPSSGNASSTQVVMGNDSRLTNSRTPTAHNQASNTINAMTGYSKPSSTSAIATTDTLNAAIGKLEKGLDNKLSLSGGTMTGDVYYKRASTDATKANNNVSSGVLYPRIKEIQDANGLRLVNLEAQINSNGKIGSYWNIRNYPVNSSSPVATGGIKMEMDKSGDITYTISDPYNFCEAIRSPRTTLVGNDSAIASGYGWYQVGKFETLSTKTDLSCMVMISNDYTNGTAANANAGLLYIHLRTGDTAGTFKHAEMKFIANNNFTTNHFKLVWRVEQDPVSLDNWMCYSLYTYIGVRYMRRRFTIMNEGYGKNNRNTFVLADKVTNSEVEPTTAQGWTNGIYAS